MQTVTKVKKAYSTIENILQQLIITEGPIKNWAYPNSKDADNSDFFASKFVPYLNVAQYCGNTTACSPNVRMYETFKGGTTGSNYWLNPNYSTYRGRAITKDGMFWAIAASISYSGSFRETLGSIRVDINGKKGPNRAGYDVFMFWFNKDGVVFTDAQGGNKNQCSKTLSPTYAHMDGASCAYWIIKHGNVKYKYQDVSSEW